MFPQNNPPRLLSKLGQNKYSLQGFLEIFIRMSESYYFLDGKVSTYLFKDSEIKLLL